MKKSLTKIQFEDLFVERLNDELDTSFSRKDASIIIGTLQDIFVEHATDERGCSYSGFMKCVAVKTKPRNGRNPATGESILIPSKIRGKATLLKAMKDRLQEAGEKAFGKGKKKKKNKDKKVKNSKIKSSKKNKDSKGKKSKKSNKSKK